MSQYIRYDDDDDDGNYVPHRREGGHIVFGVDPVGVGVGVSVTLSCLHDIS